MIINKEFSAIPDIISPLGLAKGACNPRPRSMGDSLRRRRYPGAGGFITLPALNDGAWPRGA